MLRCGRHQEQRNIRTLTLRSLCWFEALYLSLANLAAQPARAEKVRQAVEKIGTLGQITVYMPDGREFYGTVTRTSATAFSVNEVDQRREITLRYDEVKKVRGGYGTGGRTITRKRVHPRTKLIVTLAVVGGLLLLVFVAVASDHS